MEVQRVHTAGSGLIPPHGKHITRAQLVPRVDIPQDRGKKEAVQLPQLAKATKATSHLHTRDAGEKGIRVPAGALLVPKLLLFFFAWELDCLAGSRRKQACMQAVFNRDHPEQLDTLGLGDLQNMSRQKY